MRSNIIRAVIGNDGAKTEASVEVRTASKFKILTIYPRGILFFIS
ncbi:hypothetical protein [Maribacter hydrothermalis]|nr:hypothetical protein [Maribacter hydrothermalis]